MNEIDQQLAKLRRDFPSWEIWFVNHATQKGGTWCANPWAKQHDRRNVLHADTPGHLAEYIRDREAETATDGALSDAAARDLAEGDPLDPRD